MRNSRLKSANMYNQQSERFFQGYRKAKEKGDANGARRYLNAYQTAFNRGLDIYDVAVKNTQRQLERDYERKIANGEITRHQASKAVHNETQKHMNRLYSTTKGAVAARNRRANGLNGG